VETVQESPILGVQPSASRAATPPTAKGEARQDQEERTSHARANGERLENAL
jgi:hypothetical protein